MAGTSYQRALEIHQGFYGAKRTPEEDLITRIYWPQPQGVAGKALIIGYYSNKFDGRWREYTHQHETPYPSVIRQKVQGDKEPRRKFLPHYPKEYFAFLGYALDLQFDRGDGKDSFIDWKFKSWKSKKDLLPILGWCETRRLLIIQPVTTDDPSILLHSPILSVTPSGIEN